MAHCSSKAYIDSIKKRKSLIIDIASHKYRFQQHLCSVDWFDMVPHLQMVVQYRFYDLLKEYY